MVPNRLLSVDPSVVTVAGDSAGEDKSDDDAAHVVRSHLGLHVWASSVWKTENE